MGKLTLAAVVLLVVVFISGSEAKATCGLNEVNGCTDLIMGDIASRCDTYCDNGKKQFSYGSCEHMNIDPTKVPSQKCQGPMMCSGCLDYGCPCKSGYYRDVNTKKCTWKKQDCQN